MLVAGKRVLYLFIAIAVVSALTQTVSTADKIGTVCLAIGAAVLLRIVVAVWSFVLVLFYLAWMIVFIATGSLLALFRSNSNLSTTEVRVKTNTLIVGKPCSDVFWFGGVF